MKISKAEQRKNRVDTPTTPIRGETPTTPIVTEPTTTNIATPPDVMGVKPLVVEPIVKSVLGGNPLRDYKKMSFGRR